MANLLGQNLVWKQAPLPTLKDKIKGFFEPLVTLFTGLTPRERELAKVETIPATKVRLPFAKEPTVIRPVEAPLISIPLGMAGRLLEAIPKVITFTVQNYKATGAIIAGKEVKPLKIPFDARRLGFDTPEIEDAGTRLLNKFDKLNGINPPQNQFDVWKNASLSALMVTVPDALDAFVAGSTAELGAKVVLKITKYDPMLERSLSTLGLPKNQPISPTDIITRTKESMLSSKTITEYADSVKSGAYVVSKMRGEGIPILNSFFRKIQDIARDLILPLEQYGKGFMVSPIAERVGLPGYMAPKGGLAITPRVGGEGELTRRVNELAKQGLKPEVIAKQLGITEPAVKSIIKKIAITVIPKELEPLAQEMRKYETFKDLVKKDYSEKIVSKIIGKSELEAYKDLRDWAGRGKSNMEALKDFYNFTKKIGEIKPKIEYVKGIERPSFVPEGYTSEQITKMAQELERIGTKTDGLREDEIVRLYQTIKGIAGKEVKPEIPIKAEIPPIKPPVKPPILPSPPQPEMPEFAGLPKITSQEEEAILRAEFEKEADIIKQETERQLFKDIKGLGGIRSYRGKFLAEEISPIPLELRNNKTGSGMDEMADMLKAKGYNFESDSDLLEAILNIKSGRVRVVKPTAETLKTIKKFAPEKISKEAKKLLERIQQFSEDPIMALNNMLKEAKPIRKGMEKLYTEERAKRIAEVDRFINENIDQVGGEEGYAKILAKLKGELIKPEMKVSFEAIKDKLTPEQLTALLKRVWKHPYLDNWEKIRGADGLMGLLAGEIPQPSQMVLLEEIYGTDLIKNILSKRLLGLKAKDILIDIANIPKAIMATADMSAFLRQGIVEVVAHPVISAKAMAKTFQFAFSQKSFEKYFDDLPKDSLYPLMRKSGLAITDPRKALMSGREEAFISQLLEKIPIIRIPIKFAERSYVGFLNKLRVDIFKTWADELLSKGLSPVKDAEVFRAAANVINTFTGRGELPGKLNRITPDLNVIFFSPRLIAARFNALNPVWYIKQPPEIRKKAISDFAKFVAAGLTTLALIQTYKKANNISDKELDIETDLRSTDAGKIKIENTRLDMWGGFQQWARVFAQIITGERKNTSTGEIISLNKEEFPFTTRKETLYRFIEGKFSPAVQLINELMSGAKTYYGEDITFKTTIREKFIPMYIQDIADAYKDGGLGRAIGTGIAAFFGVGVQTYETKKKKKGKYRYLKF